MFCEIANMHTFCTRFSKMTKIFKTKNFMKGCEFVFTTNKTFMANGRKNAKQKLFHSILMCCFWFFFSHNWFEMENSVWPSHKNSHTNTHEYKTIEFYILYALIDRVTKVHWLTSQEPHTLHSKRKKRAQHMEKKKAPKPKPNTMCVCVYIWMWACE